MLNCQNTGKKKYASIYGLSVKAIKRKNEDRKIFNAHTEINFFDDSLGLFIKHLKFLHLTYEELSNVCLVISFINKIFLYKKNKT